MKRGLVVSTRGLLGREGKKVIHHFGIMKTLADSIDILTATKTSKTVDFVKSNTTAPIYKGINIFESYVNDVCLPRKVNSWIDVYNQLDVRPLAKYDVLFIIGGLNFHAMKLNKLTTREPFPTKADDRFIFFQSFTRHIVNILAMAKAHNEYGLPLHEIAFDPDEITTDIFDDRIKTNSSVYYGHDVPLYNIKRLDSSQYTFLNSQKSGLLDLMDSCDYADYDDKLFDLTFGYSAMSNQNRIDYIPWIESAAEKFPVRNIFKQTKEIKENVDRDVYFDLIRKSKHTFIIPAYDINCFSIYRLIESVANDCVPLIHPDCKIVDVNKSFDVDISFLYRETPTIMSSKEWSDRLNYLKTKFIITDNLFYVKE